jgi:hypothetical protein
MTKLRIAIWLATVFFIGMLFLTLVREVLLRLRPPADMP